MSTSPGALARKRFWRNRPAVAGAIVIFLGVVIAMFAYLFAPDNSTNANTQIIELKLKEPGYKITLLKLGQGDEMQRTRFIELIWKGHRSASSYIPLIDYDTENGYLNYEHYTGEESKGVWKQLPLAQIIHPEADILEVTDAETTIRLPDGRVEIKENEKLAKTATRKKLVKKRFLLGTDALGRDYFSRLLLGARVSLAVGFMAVVISLVIGLLLGSLAGYYKGWLDEGIMYIINVFWSIPTLLLALSLSLVFAQGLWQVFMAIGLTMWIEVARIVRGQFISLREQEYVEAARSLGFGNARTILRHMLPNILGPVIVIMASNFATAILLEAGLSFLGLGVDRPTPSWGMMLSDNRTFLVAGRAYLAVMPGLAICIFVLSFFLIGNGLRDAFDVKSKMRY